MSRVLVTGASGFIGKHLCAELLRSGIQVRAALRSPVGKPSDPAMEISLIGEIGSGTAWDRALSDVDIVVHLAGHTHVLQPDASADLPRFREVNVEGTRTLAEAAQKAKISRFIHLSSIKAVCESSREAVTEQMPCRPIDAYGISKLEAEAVLLNSRMDVTILRPPLVYGPGVKANFFRLIRAVDRRLPLPLGGIYSRRSFLYIGNLADAILLLIKTPAPIPGVFHIADDEPVTAGDLVLRLGRMMGKGPLLVPVPVALLRGLGYLLGRGEDVRRLTDPLVLSTGKLRSRIGWKPPFSLDQGLRETVSWYQIRGRD